MAATYGLGCRHEWGMVDTEGGVLYTCAGHLVPFAAVKETNPIKGLLYALGLFLIRGKQTTTITIY